MLKTLFATILLICGFIASAQAQTAPAPIGVAPDILRIDTLDFWVFKAGAGNDIRIEARALSPTYGRVEVLIPNIAEFPGATFDSSTGTFSWSPGVTDDQAEHYLRGPIRLEVKAIAFSETSPEVIIETTKTVLIFIQPR